MGRRSRSLGLYQLRNGMQLPSLVKSIQRGTITLTTTSNTATINAVQMDRSRLRFLNVLTQGGSAAARCRLTLTNATTVTANRNNDGGGATLIISFEVTEFQPSVVKSIQRGTVGIAGTAASGTATITAVNTNKAELSWLGSETDETTYNESDAYVDLTNSTTVTATRFTAGAGTVTASFEVVEWY